MRIEIHCQRCGESISINEKGKGTVQCPECFYAFNVPATAADVPRLCTLLEDDAFPVQEAAAMALSDLGAVEALPQLLRAYQRGVEDGDDNGGFAIVLEALVEKNEAAATPVLRDLAQSKDSGIAELAAWLLEEMHDA
jgi:hypothetical protein